VSKRRNILALNALVKRDSLSAIGEELGVGKESVDHNRNVIGMAIAERGELSKTKVLDPGGTWTGFWSR